MATPPWQQAPETAVAAEVAEPSSDGLAKQLALVGKHGPRTALSDSSDDDSDSEEDERLLPPGPLDPDKSLVRLAPFAFRRGQLLCWHTLQRSSCSLLQPCKTHPF